ncbi:MAG: hypothetical protein ACM359_14590 [Bacillota bacterium]
MTEVRVELPQGCMGVQPKTVRGPCACGVDIRPGSWDIICADVLMAPSGIHVVRPLFIGKVRDEQDVLFVMQQYKVRVGVADTRPETTLAKRLQGAARDKGIEVWRAEYNTSPGAIDIQANESEMVLKLDRTMTLDNVHYAFTTGLTVVLPQNFKEITGGQFAREMIASQRVPTRWMGKDCYMWENRGADHSFHAFNYLLAAIKKGNLIAFGGAATMGPSLGMVESSQPKNVKRDLWNELEPVDGEGQIVLEA